MTPTFSATPTVIGEPDKFFISENIFNSNKPVQIHVVITQFPGGYDLTIFNSAGEKIKTVDSAYLTSEYERTYSWDGTNNYGERCASGVYIISLTEPFKRRVARVLFVH